MKFDLTNLITNVVDAININEKVTIPDELIQTSNIRELKNVTLTGKIFKDYDMNLILNCVITGSMVLPDDITLEDTIYEFKTEIEENIEEIVEINKNSIDILDFIWQNILVEVPLKVRNSKNDNVKLEGNGWKLITEEEVNNRSYNPFSELSIILDKEGSE